MTELKLTGKTIAIIATDGFEESELTEPRIALSGQGATVHLISEKSEIRSWKEKNWGSLLKVDRLFENVKESDYDALVIPGGVINADKLRRNTNAVAFIKEFDKKNKLIAAICHGPQLLIEADIVKGNSLTSHPAIKTDLINAGADYIDKGVFKFWHFVTAQGVSDIPRFIDEIISEMSKEKN